MSAAKAASYPGHGGPQGAPGSPAFESSNAQVAALPASARTMAHGPGPQEWSHAPQPQQAQHGQQAVQPPGTRPPGAPSKAPSVRAPARPAGPPPVSFATKLRKQAPRVVFLLVAAAGYAGFRVQEARKPYEWSGTVEARQVTLASRVGGRVKTILVNEGDEVVEGQPLIVFEAGDLLAAKTVAEAEIEGNEAGVLKLETGARTQEVQQARARVNTMGSSAASAVALLQREEMELKRARTLFASNAISKQELEQKEATARAAAAEVGRASASTAEASAAFQLVKTGSRAEDVRIAKASLAAARGRLDAINGQLAELTVRAARAARVESITVRPGDILMANAAAVTVLEAGQLYVRIYVPETQIGKIAVGQNVPITVDSFPSRSFQGKVIHINEVGEFTPRNMTTTDDRADEVFAARISLVDGQRELRAGMVAMIQIAKK